MSEWVERPTYAGWWWYSAYEGARLQALCVYEEYQSGRLRVTGGPYTQSGYVDRLGKGMLFTPAEVPAMPRRDGGVR